MLLCTIMQSLPVNLQTFIISGLINALIIVLFCRSLIKALSYVSPENRTISQLMIWLLLLPGVNKVLNFLVVIGMSKSIANELADREFEDVKRPGFISGMIFAVLSVVFEVIFPLALIYIPVVKEYMNIISAAAFLQIIFFIQYWMRINWYKRILEKDSENELEEL